MLDSRPKPADTQDLYYEALLQVTPVATVTLEPDAKVTSWNPANTTILGAAKFGRMCGELEELAGKDRLEEAGSRVAHTEAEHARRDNALRAVQ